MAHRIIYSAGLVNLSVCVHKSMSQEEIEEWANEEQPTGIDSKWKISKVKEFSDGTPMPCVCRENHNHRHWLLVC